MPESMTAAGTGADGLYPRTMEAGPWQRFAVEYQRALWAGDHALAERVACEALELSGNLSAVYERLIAPTLHQVGVLWSAGELTVADEHAATEATIRAMAAAFATAEGRSGEDRFGRRVITATAEGERHAVGVRMAADVLELAGHEVIHCGADTPTDDLAALVDSTAADAVAISFTMASSGDLLGAMTRNIWRAAPTLPILVGGQGLPTHLPSGPIIRIGNLGQLLEVVEELPSRAEAAAVPRPRPAAPTFGRPTAAGVDREVSAAGPEGTPALPYLTTIFKDAEDAIVTVDAAGLVTAFNRAAELLWGLAATDAIGRPVWSVIGAARQSRVLRRRLRDALLGTAAELRSVDSAPDDGAPREVLIRFLPVPHQDRIVGAALVAHEVKGQPARVATIAENSPRLWHNRIEYALKQDRFVLASQPIIDLASDGVDHCELLLRMRMGGRIVMPGEFIPPAERSGQIRAIDMWVARRGIELADEHPVAINLSGASLSSRELLPSIEEALTHAGVQPDRVTFEITETAAAENLEEAVSLVNRLRELGCRVALDDFGTGFGSFTYLSRLPVTEIKIDGEFVRAVRGGEAERRVVDAVVSVGSTFGIRTVAEGVEDEETLDILREAGVDLGQGWLFGKPALVGGPDSGSDQDR